MGPPLPVQVGGDERVLSTPCFPAGVASVVVSFFLSMYYNIINAWAFWYLFHSFQVSEPTPEQEQPCEGEGRAGLPPGMGWRLGGSLRGSQEAV